MQGGGRLYVLGIGGHARSVTDAAVAAGFSDILLVDVAARPGETFAGFLSLTRLPEPSEPGAAVIPGIGDNAARRRACAGIEHCLAVLAAADATLGLSAEIGPGTVILRHAHVGPNTRIGTGVIVNTGAIVDHDCRIGDFVHVAVGATLAGRVTIGENSMIGAGATVVDGVAICADVVLGAGATAVRDIVEPGVYVGTPARLLRR